jgi:hypothetical protein
MALGMGVCALVPAGLGWLLHKDGGEPPFFLLGAFRNPAFDFITQGVRFARDYQRWWPRAAPCSRPAKNEQQNLTGNSHSDWYSEWGQVN